MAPPLSVPDPLLWPPETRFLRAPGTCVRVSSRELTAELLARTSLGYLLSECCACFAIYAEGLASGVLHVFR